MMRTSQRPAKTAGSVADLVQQVSIVLHNMSLVWRLHKEINEPKFITRMKNALPKSARPTWGVLVCLGIQRSKLRSDAGHHSMYMGSKHVAGVGLTPDGVLREYLRLGSLVSLPGSGWVREDCFLWVPYLVLHSGHKIPFNQARR